MSTDDDYPRAVVHREGSRLREDIQGANDYPRAVVREVDGQLVLDDPDARGVIPDTNTRRPADLSRKYSFATCNILKQHRR